MSKLVSDPPACDYAGHISSAPVYEGAHSGRGLGVRADRYHRTVAQR